ncbi:MAG: hypothetical protein AAFV51_08240 [Pseudomonadota bacterium]
MIVLQSSALVAAFLAAVVATAGLAAVVIRRDVSSTLEPLLSTAAAALLAALALTHLVPESIEALPNGAALVLAGFVGFAALDRIGRSGAGGWAAPAIAIGAHSFIDGFFYVGAFEHGAAVGAAASAGLIVHEFSEAILLYSLARRGGAGARGAFAIAFIGAAATTPAGAIVGSALADQASGELLDTALAVLAGALLYLGAARLAEIEEGPRRPVSTLAAMAIGVAGGLLASHVGHVHHDHDHDPDETHADSDH